MRRKLMTLGDAEKYLLEEYGLKWSRPTWRRRITEGKLRGFQSKEPRGWWYVEPDSIDEFLEGS